MIDCEYLKTKKYGMIPITKDHPTQFDTTVDTVMCDDGAEFIIFRVPEGYLMAYEN